MGEEAGRREGARERHDGKGRVKEVGEERPVKGQ